MSNASPDKRRGNPRRGTLGGGIMINGEFELDSKVNYPAQRNAPVDFEGLLPGQARR